MDFDDWMLMIDPKYHPTDDTVTLRKLRECWKYAGGNVGAGVTAAQKRDAERYRQLRRGQHWSVIDGIGDAIRADHLDAAIDAVIATHNVELTGAARHEMETKP